MTGYYRLNCKLPESGATLYLLNLNRDASFMVMRYCPGGPEIGYKQSSCESGLGWCLLDLKARRWYIAKDKDQTPRLNSGGLGVAIDGDLACRFLYNRAIVNNPTTDFVFNPIAKTLTALPKYHRSPQSCVELNMVVDSIYPQNFMLIFVHPSLHQKFNVTGDPSMYLEDPFMHVYDSITNFWHGVYYPRLLDLDMDIDSFQMPKSVMFHGLMYILLSFPDQREHMLWRFELLQLAWEYVAVCIPGELFMPKLVVSANRLFLVGWWEDPLSESIFQVSEINVPILTRQAVLELTKSDMEKLFKIKTKDEILTEKYFRVTWGVPMEVPKRIVCPSISAFGFGNSVMLMSVSSGTSMVYDLETGFWHKLGQKPLGHTPANSRSVGKKWINLLQPNAIWWRGRLLWTWH